MISNLILDLRWMESYSGPKRESQIFYYQDFRMLCYISARITKNKWHQTVVIALRDVRNVSWFSCSQRKSITCLSNLYFIRTNCKLIRIQLELNEEGISVMGCGCRGVRSVCVLCVLCVIFYQCVWPCMIQFEPRNKLSRCLLISRNCNWSRTGLISKARH